MNDGCDGNTIELPLIRLYDAQLYFCIYGSGLDPVRRGSAAYPFGIHVAYDHYIHAVNPSETEKGDGYVKNRSYLHAGAIFRDKCKPAVID